MYESEGEFLDIEVTGLHHDSYDVHYFTLFQHVVLDGDEELYNDCTDSRVLRFQLETFKGFN